MTGYPGDRIPFIVKDREKDRDRAFLPDKPEPNFNVFVSMEYLLRIFVIVFGSILFASERIKTPMAYENEYS